MPGYPQSTPTTINRRRRIIGLLGATWPLAHVSQVFAQNYPTKPVAIVNPYSPGAGVDPVARLLAQKMTERLGQQFVVENRMGAAGMVGAGYVAAAKPDGYTLLMSAANDIAINQHLYKDIKYQADRDLVPITQLVQLPMVMVVHPDVPAKTLTEFLALARAKPGGLTYATPGNGTLQHLVAAQLQNLAGIQMLHVPYKDRLMIDLLAGRVDASFLGAHVVAQQVKAGKLRALFITSQKRASTYPDLPTVAELGHPGLEMMQWFGAYAPAGTPDPIIRTLNRELVAILSQPDVRSNLLQQGTEPVGSTPEAFARFIKAEIDRFGALVRSSGATAE
jgi:tripartite-type tricarboxylate transporter receptor subunit TctC